MRLTQLGNRLALAAAIMGAIAPVTGCHRRPYIDQTREVPPVTAEHVADRDDKVQQAQFLESNLPMPLPRVHDPRTTANPEAQEIWPMTLEEAIKIGLENSEVVRVIALGAEGIPVSGFEPANLALPGGVGGAAGGGVAGGGTLGAGSLETVYDPAIAETQIAYALSNFDAALTTDIFWGHSTQPLNNAIQAGFFGGLTGTRFPVLFNQDTATFVSSLGKKIATGGIVGITHNISYLWSNSPVNVFPSAYTTNLQLSFAQPLLGGGYLGTQALNTLGSPLAGIGVSPVTGRALGYSGLEANRAPIVIARLNADINVWRFKANIQSMVRSIEQQYWVLVHKYVALWSAQTAFDLSQELLNDVLANQEVGTIRGSRKEVATAQVQVEQARLNLVTATSDVLYTERQMRNILGLPPADNRRIVPVSEPTDARLEPDWEASLAQMVTFQPDIVQAQLLARASELQLLVARNTLLPALNFETVYQFNGLGHQLDQAEKVMTGGGLLAIDPLLQLQRQQAGLNSVPQRYTSFLTWQIGLNFSMPLGYRGPLANARSAQYALLRQRAYLQQIVHQTTHALARFFLEVDANYKRFKAAQRLKEAAWVRLDYNKARYDSGDRDPSRSQTPSEAVTLTTLIDSINSWTQAIAEEAQFKSTYNTSIAVLEEAKGTLLAYDNIAVAEGPWPRKAYIQARDQQRGHRQLPVGLNGPMHPEGRTGPPVADPVPPQAPPDLKPPGPVPALPAPGGPLGPAPRSLPPAAPAGEPNSLSDGTRPAMEPNFLRATGPASNPASPPGPIPGVRSQPPTRTVPATITFPDAVPATAPAPPVGTSPPPSAPTMELPPLPPRPPGPTDPPPSPGAPPDSAPGSPPPADP